MVGTTWLDHWKRAKKEFEDATEKKKPHKHVLGVFRKSSGVESALKTCDKAVKGVTPERGKKEKSEKVLQKAIEKFRKTKAGYLDLLDKAINKEIKVKEEKTIYYRATKTLRARLDQYETDYEETLAFSTAKLDKEDKYSDKHWKIAEKKLKSALAKCVAASKEVKTGVARSGQPEATGIGSEARYAWVSEMPYAIRQLRSALDDVAKARKQGGDFPDPARFAKLLKRIDGLSLPMDVDPKQIEKLNKQFTGILKDVQNEYGLR